MVQRQAGVLSLLTQGKSTDESVPAARNPRCGESTKEDYGVCSSFNEDNALRKWNFLKSFTKMLEEDSKDG